jgi:hypothetical protein
VSFAGPDGAEHPPVGAIMVDGQEHPIQEFESVGLDSVLGDPHVSDIVVNGPQGLIRLRAEVIHTLPLTITEANENFNGIDWELDGDPICFTECIARLTAPDGSVGFGHFERSARRSALPRPTPGSP